jgi:hypothetical protein
VLALAGAPLGVMMAPSQAHAQGAGNPTDVLTLLLKLKYLTSTFYAAGLATTYPVDFLPDERAVVAQAAKHEAAHVTTLRTALGGMAPAAPAASTYDFTIDRGTGCGPFRGALGAPATTAPDSSAVAATDPDKLEFLKVAMLLEDLCVRACIGGFAALVGTPHLSLASRMHLADARHSAGIRALRNSYPFDPSTYVQPAMSTYYYVPPWPTPSDTGGVGFADLLFTGTAVYSGGLTQRDVANGKATSTTDTDGTVHQTTVMVGVYGPKNPTSTTPLVSLGEDNTLQSSSQVDGVLIPRIHGDPGDRAFDEPLSAASVAELLALFGVA